MQCCLVTAPVGGTDLTVISSSTMHGGLCCLCRRVSDINSSFLGVDSVLSAAPRSLICLLSSANYSTFSLSACMTQRCQCWPHGHIIAWCRYWASQLSEACARKGGRNIKPRSSHLLSGTRECSFVVAICRISQLLYRASKTPYNPIPISWTFFRGLSRLQHCL